MTLLNFASRCLWQYAYRDAVVGFTDPCFELPISRFLVMLYLLFVSFGVSSPTTTEKNLTARLLCILMLKQPQQPDYFKATPGVIYNQTINLDGIFSISASLPPATKTRSHERFVKTSISATAFANCCCFSNSVILHNKRCLDLGDQSFFQVPNQARSLCT